VHLKGQVQWGSGVARRYDNCETRTVVLADGSGGSAGLDPLWFPGGHRMGQGARAPDNGSAHAKK
jgi:hypothetical protein